MRSSEPTATAGAVVSGARTVVADGGPGPAAEGRFTVRLSNFEGPFDLLLQLIGRRKLDVTEIALSVVTDEFIAHLRALGDELDLDQASEFLVVASTLLDLKAARLLPAAEVHDEDDLELLEARDLLFARLLQYKAYQQAAEFLRQRAADAARRFPRQAGADPRFRSAEPEVQLGMSAAEFAALAARVLTPKPAAVVSVAHLHAAPVSMAEQVVVVRGMLTRAGSATFRAISADCGSTLEVVGRFLALLELYRQQCVAFDQLAPLGELHVRWTGGAGRSVPGPRAELLAAGHRAELAAAVALAPRAAAGRRLELAAAVRAGEPVR